MKHIKPWLTRLIFTLALFGICFIAFDIRIYYGNNMYPAVRDGDLVLSYKLSSPNPDDIVLYQHDGQMRLGRVVALPNSTVEISEDKTIKINGTDETENAFYPTDQGNINSPYTVPADSYFILNDYRSDVEDSRTYEAVKADDIKGIVSFIIRRRGF